MKTSTAPESSNRKTYPELRFTSQHLSIGIDPKTGNLTSITRLSDGELIYTGKPEDGTRVCCGGAPARILSRGGADMWTLLVDNPPSGSVFIGRDAIMTGQQQTDTGNADEIAISQRDGDLRITTTYRLLKRAPILSFDLEIQNLGERDLNVHFLDKPWDKWSFTDERCIWKTDKGNFQTQPLNCGGSAVFWRESEGDWWTWNITPEPRKSMDCKLLMGGRLKARGPAMRGGGFHLGLSEHEGYRSANIAQEWCTSQHMKPLPGVKWTAGANLLETFIGFRMIVGNERMPTPWKHSPYPTTQDLRNDLPRIKEIGYDVLYLMPRQPYPGYTTHSLDNAAEQYGDGPKTEEAFKSLIREAHALGMRVIVDVVLHGGMDYTSLQNSFEVTKLNGPGGVGTNNDIVHREYLLANAPKKHPFWEKHPEWFSLITKDECHMGYTRFFDLRHPGFQKYFAQSLTSMIENFDIDGFRFDAPWWTPAAYRWTEDAGYRASWSVGASMELISALYKKSHTVKPDALFFMESSDPFTCQTAHMQYPYDVQRVIFTQMHKNVINAREAREGLTYLRKIRLPEMRTAYWFVDSHDSVWGYLPKEKWLRNFIGLPKTRAYAALMALLGDAIMSYSGSEEGMEELFKQLLHLRREHPVLREGACNEIAVDCSHDDIFPIWRTLKRDWLLPVISFSEETRHIELKLPIDIKISTSKDLLNPNRAFPIEGNVIHLELQPHEFCILSPSA
jgi:hypothetical protein